MKIHLLLICLCTCIAGSAFAQQLSLNGYIQDASTGERLASVSVINTISKEGTSSNAYGYFSLKLPKGQHQVVFQTLNYAADTLELNLDSDSTTLIKLVQLSTSLGEVVVLAPQQQDLALGGINKVSISPGEIKSLPKFGGETDLIKALQLMPGVRAGRDGSSDLLVRGGGPDQNLILLDGVPIYNSAHSLGLFSVFNADAIKGVSLLKGSFPARYGGRLSSVLDIQLKDGNNDHLRYDASIGLISSKLMLEGPLGSEKTTFVIAGRRTYLDLLAAIAQKKTDEKIGYSFYDVNAKITHKLSDRDRIFFSLYSGNDQFRLVWENANGSNEDLNSISWGSVTSALRYNRVLSNKLFGNLTLTHTSYKFDVLNSEKDTDDQYEYELNYASKIADAALKLDFDYYPSNKHILRFGSSLILHNFQPNVTSLKNVSSGTVFADTTYYQNNTRAQDIFFYAEDEIQLSDKWQVNLGAHLGSFNVNQKSYMSFQPRVSVNWFTTQKSALRMSFARMNQNIHLLTATGSGGPADIWVPSTDRILPQRSWQATAGWMLRPTDQLEINVDAYYKELQNVVEYEQGASYLADDPESSLIEESSRTWEDKVVQGTGNAYGLELMLRKKAVRTFGWLGYNLAWSNRKIPGVNNGQTYPFSFDSRHSLVAVANHHLSKRIRLSGSWVYNSGIPYTIALSSFKYYSEGHGSINLEDISVRNNYRMRAYHRLDMSISFIKEKRRGERSWNISVYNLYNRQNPYFVGVGYYEGSNKLRQLSLLPIIPSFSYSFSFR